MSECERREEEREEGVGVERKVAAVAEEEEGEFPADEAAGTSAGSVAEAKYAAGDEPTRPFPREVESE